MAKANVCDCCGRLYVNTSWNDNPSQNSAYRWNNAVGDLEGSRYRVVYGVMKIDAEGDENKVGKAIDVCPRCARKLMKNFRKIKKDEEEATAET